MSPTCDLCCAKSMIHLGVPNRVHMHGSGCQNVQGRVVGHTVSGCTVIFFLDFVKSQAKV